MQLSDVLADYPYCSFCGRGVRADLAFRDEAGSLFHTRDCYEFSIEYPALIEQVMARQQDREGAPTSEPAG